MLKHEYIPFQYVVVYIAVLQVSSFKVRYQETILTKQGGMGAGQWLSYGPSRLLRENMLRAAADTI